MQVLNLSRTIYFRLFVKNKIENDCFAYWGKAREIEGFKMSFGTILTMAGGLGLFLFGMELMSDSIEKVAGGNLYHEPFHGYDRRYYFYRYHPVLLRMYGYGRQLC